MALYKQETSHLSSSLSALIKQSCQNGHWSIESVLSSWLNSPYLDKHSNILYCCHLYIISNCTWLDRFGFVCLFFVFYHLQTESVRFKCFLHCHVTNNLHFITVVPCWYLHSKNHTSESLFYNLLFFSIKHTNWHFKGLVTSTHLRFQTFNWLTSDLRSTNLAITCKG